jgi:hypothetical protein
MGDFRGESLNKNVRIEFVSVQSGLVIYNKMTPLVFS